MWFLGSRTPDIKLSGVIYVIHDSSEKLNYCVHYTISK